MYRERLTITLDAELLEAVDTTIDRSLIRNRSHAIEHLLKEGLALHQLKQAFFVMHEDWDSTTLPKIIELSDHAGITEYFLIATPLTTTLAADIAATIRSLSTLKPSVTQLPGDFGTAGALALKKEELQHPFLFVELKAGLTIPARLAAAYSFHRLHNGLVTIIVTADTPDSFQSTGFFILSPELLQSVPAGAISLEETIFPALLKEGKVRTYLSS